MGKKINKGQAAEGLLQMKNDMDQSAETNGVFPIITSIHNYYQETTDERQIILRMKDEMKTHKGTGEQNFLERVKDYTDEQFHQVIKQVKYEDLKKTSPIYEELQINNFIGLAAEILTEAQQVTDEKQLQAKIKDLQDKQVNIVEGNASALIGRSHYGRISQLEMASLISISVIQIKWSHSRLLCKRISQNYISEYKNLTFQEMNENNTVKIVNMEDIKEVHIPRAIKVVRKEFEGLLTLKKLEVQNLSQDNRESMYKLMITQMSGNIQDFLTKGSFKILTALQQMEFDHELTQRLIQKETSLQSCSFVLNFISITGKKYPICEIFEKQAIESLRRRVQLRMIRIAQILYRTRLTQLREKNAQNTILSDAERSDLVRVALENIYFRIITGAYQQNPYGVNMGDQGFAYNKDCGRHEEYNEGKPEAEAGGFAFLGKAINFGIKALKKGNKIAQPLSQQ